MDSFQSYHLDYNSPLDPDLQSEIESAHRTTREKFGILPEQAAFGILDLRRSRLAMLHPDRIEYAASVPKIAILLVYFALRPAAATNLPAEVRHELGLMIKASSNQAAAKFSRELGLKNIQQVIEKSKFYDPQRGGGLWVGKHYGASTERYGDPLADHSHAATVRQLLRYYLLLEQRALISRAASETMLEIFESPQIPHDQIKFVKALAPENVRIIRKWGSWEDWLHDTAVVQDDRRHYIIVGLTHHPRGDNYLEEMARAIHRLM